MVKLNNFKDFIYYTLLFASIIIVVISVFITSLDLMISGFVLHIINIMFSYILDIFGHIVNH